VFVYVATLIVLELFRTPFQWAGLVCVTVATTVVVAVAEKGRWSLGLFVPPRLAVPEFLRGTLWGFTLIGSCGLLIVLTTGVRHTLGNGFPWRELVTMFLPAAVHEELLFRGYVFQKLLQRHRRFALVSVALLFAALHLENTAVTAIGLANIFLGGLLLGLAYERYRRLWFPIGIHLAWNLMTGPILGHEVSGYIARQTVLVVAGTGPDLLTGGDFGIEGSVLMTFLELAAIALLVRRTRLDRRVA
jgi:membrane protease YdiL (CAAX protease family)